MEQLSIKTPNPKCRLFFKITSKGTWQQVFICLRPPITSTPRPFTRCMNTYQLPHRERGVGGGGRWTSEKVREALVHKRGRKFQHDWPYIIQSINSFNHQERRHLGFGVFIDIRSMLVLSYDWGEGVVGITLPNFAVFAPWIFFAHF